MKNRNSQVVQTIKNTQYYIKVVVTFMMTATAVFVNYVVLMLKNMLQLILEGPIMVFIDIGLLQFSQKVVFDSGRSCLRHRRQPHCGSEQP